MEARGNMLSKAGERELTVNQSGYLSGLEESLLELLPYLYVSLSKKERSFEAHVKLPSDENMRNTPSEEMLSLSVKFLVSRIRRSAP